MKKNKLIKIFILSIICCSMGSLVYASNNNSDCPELEYLAAEYSKAHADKVQSVCMIKGSLDEKCYEIARMATDKFNNCFDNCGGNDPDGHIEKCGNPYDSSLPDCYWYECGNKIDNDCALKCKYHLSFDYRGNGNIQGNLKGKDSNDEENNLNSERVGLPVDLGSSISSCIGKTPKNANLCPGDNENILEYTEKQLVDSCSSPKGSEPKCEYVCKTEYLDDGTCKEEGFFKKILNWLGGLF